jgi:hemolysin III
MAETERRGLRATRVGFFSEREELLNSVTHGIGAGLSVAGLIVLLVQAWLYGDGWRVASTVVYGSSLVILYSASTLYHGVRREEWKKRLRVLDHASVYLLIAGTYTPFLLIRMRGTFGWTMLVVVWALALLGIVYKVFFLDRYPVLATLGYVAMGWLAVFGARQGLRALEPAGIAWLVAGGLTYTVGVLFFAYDRIPYNHAIWHLFVLGGSVCHYFAVLFHVLPV